MIRWLTGFLGAAAERRLGDFLLGVAAAVGLLRQVRGSFGDDLDLDVEGAGEARDEEITPALT